jgi:hypothetical protein
MGAGIRVSYNFPTQIRLPIEARHGGTRRRDVSDCRNPVSWYDGASRPTCTFILFMGR